MASLDTYSSHIRLGSFLPGKKRVRIRLLPCFLLKRLFLCGAFDLLLFIISHCRGSASFDGWFHHGPSSTQESSRLSIHRH